MGKLRVHELAKKVGLTNSEVISKLQAGGLAVKTHSSSVHEDEAMGILGKEGISAPVENPKPKRKGMMIVRKKDKEAAAATGAATEAAVGGLDEKEEAALEADASAAKTEPSQVIASEIILIAP